MARYVGTRTIEAPIEDVFDYRLDVRHLPEYNPKTSAICLVRGQHGMEGSTYRFRLRLGLGLHTQVTLSVRNIERPRRLEFHIQSLMNACEVCTFEAAQRHERPATRIAFEYTVDTLGGPLAPFVDIFFVTPNMRRLVEDELDLIKLRLEAPRLGEVSRIKGCPP